MRGSIKRLGENHWKLTFDLHVPGKRRQKVVRFHGTKKAAEAKLADLLNDAREGYTGTRQTLAGFLREWIDSRTVTANTKHGYENTLKYVEAHFGELRLSDLSAARVQQFYARLLQTGCRKAKTPRGLKPSSVAQVHHTLKTALGDARRMGLVAFNACDQVRAPVEDRTVPKVLNQLEARQLLEKLVGTEWYFFVLLALITGCRLGELAGLKTEDFRLDESILLVQRSVDPHGNVKSPKNGRARVVPLPPGLAPILKQHLPERGYLFPLIAHRTASASARFSYFCRKIGYDGIHLHTFRHTVGSLLMARGVHPKAVQQLLGHHAVAYTMEVYSHLMPGAFDDTTKPLSDLVRDRSVITDGVSLKKDQ